MMLINLFRSVSIISIALIVIGCGSKGKQIDETTTRGNISVAVDASYQKLVDAEWYVFSSLYKYALVNPIYTSEGRALELLKSDSVRFVLMSRKLREDEKVFFKDKNRIPKETLIAYDGVAFICNQKNTDTTLTYTEIKNLFSGRTKTWKELGAPSNDSVLLVFESHKSGNARFIKDHFKLNALPANCFAVDDNEQVIKYVEEHPSAIGILSSGLISDMDDSLSQQFLDRVHVMGVSAKDDPEGVNGFVQPYQEYIGDGSYPFKREIYIVNCEIGTRLGTGFASFIASDKGQRIILKSGLLPAVTPVRFIEVSNEF
jgi:phosphate transport system substrate-binding protein